MGLSRSEFTGILNIKPRKINLTTYEFYNDILEQISSNINKELYSIVRIDFNNLSSISPLVLPLLFCLGVDLKSKGYTPEIDIIPHLNRDGYDSINYYLEYSSFYKINNELNIFNVRLNNKNKIENDAPIRLFYFKSEEINKNSIYCRIYKEANILLDTLEIKHSEKREKNLSIIVETIYKLVDNSIEHGKSSVFVSLSYVNNKFLICVSDFGVGFYSSIENKYQSILMGKYTRSSTKKLIKELHTKSKEKSKLKEAYGIMMGIAYRIVEEGNNIYGLSSLMNLCLINNGLVRIHSNNVQLILTKKDIAYLLGKDNLDKIYKEVEDAILVETNQFYGAHVELELEINNDK